MWQTTGRPKTKSPGVSVRQAGSKVDFRAEGAGLEPASAGQTRWIISPLPYRLGLRLRIGEGRNGFEPSSLDLPIGRLNLLSTGP